MAQFRAAIDGGSRGNPGPAAWGVAILDDDGRYREGHAGTIGKATNNVAEYNSLLEALRLAAEHRAESVDLVADSELMVKQINGEYRVKNAGLRPLYEEARRRIRAFASFRIRAVRREANKEADRLVNKALDEAAGDLAVPVSIHDVP